LGALDNNNIEALAERLGLGERQLRRLFHQQLGASPIAVAQTRRILLAKQLIHETHLPMTEIAFAAGFGSIRRFNETFLTLFDRSPSALRRERGPEVSAGPQGKIELMLSYHPPYDWPAMLDFLRLRAIPGIESVGSNSYSRSIELDGVTGSITVQPSDRHALRVTVQFPKLSALPTIIGRLRRVFDLAADPTVIAAHLANDTNLAALIKARPGLRVPGAWDGFELAMRAVLGQQITVAAAVRLAGRLVAEYGKHLAVANAVTNGAITHLFPRAEILAVADLSSLGMPRSRAATLSAVAAAVVADKQLLDTGNNLEQAVQKLRAIRGVGEWTAQYIALRQLRESDAFPAADVALQRALANLEKRPYSAKELLARSTQWQPWRAYAAQHLWTSLVAN
jgi:AraC family transcriptional regulator of adaptative response / DNA-3-methyladenine glycosylase II